MVPALPFEYRLLSDIVERQYSSENQVLRVIAYFAAICIFISCLGLLGLSAYTTERRTREIGIRKVLGAGVVQILGLLFRNIFFLVCLGSVLASVISYLSITAWLDNFAYRDEINFLMFPTPPSASLVWRSALGHA